MCIYSMFRYCTYCIKNIVKFSLVRLECVSPWFNSYLLRNRHNNSITFDIHKSCAWPIYNVCLMRGYSSKHIIYYFQKKHTYLQVASYSLLFKGGIHLCSIFFQMRNISLFKWYQRYQEGHDISNRFLRYIVHEVCILWWTS